MVVAPHYQFSVVVSNGVQVRLEIYGPTAVTTSCSFDQLFEIAAQYPIHKRAVDSFHELQHDIWYEGTGIKPTLANIALSMRHVLAADLDYSLIVIEPLGLIDGTHRLVKAKLLGHEFVKCTTIPLHEFLDHVRKNP
jgi:hypothetical protein